MRHVKRGGIILGSLFLLLSVFAGAVLGSLWEPGMTLIPLFQKTEHWIQGSETLSFHFYTLKGAAVCGMFTLLGVLVYLTSGKSYLFGKEYGTARLLDARTVDAKLRDPDAGNNRYFSMHLAVSLNGKATRLNNNVLVVGGSGAGKTLFFAQVNLLLCEGCSFVVTDPKGENLKNCAGILKEKGYTIRVLNLTEMEKSDGYNPFTYIRSENDILRLVTNLIGNTTPPESKSNDPFWEKSEGMLLQALFLFVWMELPREKQNIPSVMYLLSLAQANEDGKNSQLDKMFDALARRSEKGRLHPAVKMYDACMNAAPDTVRSILVSARARLAYLNGESVGRLLEKDELHIPELGIGKDGDGITKTALFCVIPDSDKSYSFLVGMLYTQIFQELYFQADFCYGGSLPIPVTFLLDEFANVPLPNDFCSLLSTMRGRNISAVIILQNIAQIKAMYKDTWETVPGNCDTYLYLGGNEQSSHKYTSELMGKGTFDKRSNSQTKGSHGSSSASFDVFGRELFLPEEVRMLDNKKCLLLIRGFQPILDDKFDTFSLPEFRRTANGGGTPYVHQKKGKEPFRILNEEAVVYLQNQPDKKVSVLTFDAEAFIKIRNKGELEK